MKPMPGDVINTESHPKWWQFWLKALKWGIQRHQKKLGLKNWKHTHTMMYFDETHIFSCTYPRTKWETWETVRERDFQVYRFVLRGWLDKDLPLLRGAADAMIGTHYDIRQLIDIGINRLLGYPRGRWLRIFDGGILQRVCSVAVRVIFEHFRKRATFWDVHTGQPSSPYPRLFTRGEEKLHVERTTPAHFASLEEFCLVFGAKDLEGDPV